MVLVGYKLSFVLIDSEWNTLMPYLVASGGASTFPPVVSVHESADGWDCLTYATRLQVIQWDCGFLKGSVMWSCLECIQKSKCLFDC